MLIQFLLILAALVLFSTFLRLAHTARLQAFKRIGFLLFCLFGVIAVLRPGVMTWLANQVGVGRGTDLLLYILVVVFAFFSLNTYLRFKDTERRLTKLARAMAIRDAVAPPVRALEQDDPETIVDQDVLAR
ncbi:DUF2304 domain-containing protein [Actinospica robiniae]|uniref:DUF2304 domain-containing protein n=1 Tax=Actinospica robiniae TaxID=304901 RepID=UPI0003F994F7|nr:DUF2304 domain-containing protein [Actinospica robiniae]